VKNLISLYDTWRISWREASRRVEEEFEEEFSENVAPLNKSVVLYLRNIFILAGTLRFREPRRRQVAQAIN
jgi:hypothetical protein